MLDKLGMRTKNIVGENIKNIGTLFPNCIVEAKNDDGSLISTIDFDLLKEELSEHFVEGFEERYQLMWPDKSKNKILANMPTNNTLRPYKSESVDFDKTKNLYLEGDNIEVLKVLQEDYFGSIDTIYIDPPYNTGTDIIYRNDYSMSSDQYREYYEKDEEGDIIYVNKESNGMFHSNWLNMMYPRIRLAKNLLSENGFFLTAIDHNELFNLGHICDEIFGTKNRIGVITIVHKPEGRNQAKFIGPSTEYMLVYAKNESVAELQKVVLDEEQSKQFDLKDDYGVYRLKNFIRLSDGKYATRESKPTFWYPIYVSEDLQYLSISPFEGGTPTHPITKQGVERTWKTTKETFVERYKKGNIVAKEEGGEVIIYEKLREDQVIKTHWIDKKYHGFHFGTKILDDIIGIKTFDFPKSVYLMSDIFKLFTPKNGTILDFFSGSGTSAHSIMMLNADDGGDRKFIMVQIPEPCNIKSNAYKAGFKNICDIGKERIRRVGTQLKQKQTKSVDERCNLESLDVGFRVLKLDASNMKDVYYTPDKTFKHSLDDLLDNVKEDRTSEDLLFQVMLELGIKLSVSIEEDRIAGKKVFSVDDGYMIACFDDEISDEVVMQISRRLPYYAVMKDSSMSNDSVAINFEQIFKAYSPDTIRKVI